MSYKLIMTIEAKRGPVEEILDSVDLGEFETEEECRSAYEEILESAGYDENGGEKD